MQVNVAHSPDETVELEEHTVKPSQLFVKKSASSSNIHETKFNGDLQRTATNPSAVVNSVCNTGWVMHITCSYLSAHVLIVCLWYPGNHLS